ncbi:unnamed protein product [Vitrella brassicaformis CCMP3155]|uniref:Uncharacterized protein n=2 Tax=Vitrella brassicaformis TaxID=1169539 RepID=A0A0G4H1I4_VITBC|nr:unnamed protein product [Vitrella brassicaformis CCMP3155]|eukprot:CEM37461.1 unnamed protein product [Vitrella brassicaformis CCMP3155]
MKKHQQPSSSSAAAAAGSKSRKQKAAASSDEDDDHWMDVSCAPDEDGDDKEDYSDMPGLEFDVGFGGASPADAERPKKLSKDFENKLKGVFAKQRPAPSNQSRQDQGHEPSDDAKRAAAMQFLRNMSPFMGLEELLHPSPLGEPSSPSSSAAAAAGPAPPKQACYDPTCTFCGKPRPDADDDEGDVTEDDTPSSGGARGAGGGKRAAGKGGRRKRDKGQVGGAEWQKTVEERGRDAVVSVLVALLTTAKGSVADEARLKGVIKKSLDTLIDLAFDEDAEYSPFAASEQRYPKYPGFATDPDINGDLLDKCADRVLASAWRPSYAKGSAADVYRSKRLVEAITGADTDGLDRLRKREAAFVDELLATDPKVPEPAVDAAAAAEVSGKTKRLKPQESQYVFELRKRQLFALMAEVRLNLLLAHKANKEEETKALSSREYEGQRAKATEAVLSIYRDVIAKQLPVVVEQMDSGEYDEHLQRLGYDAQTIAVAPRGKKATILVDFMTDAFIDCGEKWKKRLPFHAVSPRVIAESVYSTQEKVVQQAGPDRHFSCGETTDIPFVAVNKTMTDSEFIPPIHRLKSMELLVLASSKVLEMRRQIMAQFQDTLADPSVRDNPTSEALARIMLKQAKEKFAAIQAMHETRLKDKEDVAREVAGLPPLHAKQSAKERKAQLIERMRERQKRTNQKKGAHQQHQQQHQDGPAGEGPSPSSQVDKHHEEDQEEARRRDKELLLSLGDAVSDSDDGAGQQQQQQPATAAGGKKKKKRKNKGGGSGGGGKVEPSAAGGGGGVEAAEATEATPSAAAGGVDSAIPSAAADAADAHRPSSLGSSFRTEEGIEQSLDEGDWTYRSRRRGQHRQTAGEGSGNAADSQVQQSRASGSTSQTEGSSVPPPPADGHAEWHNGHLFYPVGEGIAPRQQEPPSGTSKSREQEYARQQRVIEQLQRQLDTLRQHAPNRMSGSVLETDDVSSLCTSAEQIRAEIDRLTALESKVLQRIGQIRAMQAGRR